MRIFKNKCKGFTLVEIIVVLVIIAILAAIAIPAFTSYIDKARNKVLLANTSDLARYIQAEILYEGFDDEHMFTYKRSDEGDTSFLSKYLEVNWEVLNFHGDEDNDNILALKNPISGKVGIVNWSYSLPDAHDGLYSQQAFYITKDSNVRYVPGDGKKIDHKNGYYHGSVIMWYDEYNSKIYLYYVSTDGMQSEKYYLFD